MKHKLIGVIAIAGLGAALLTPTAQAAFYSSSTTGTEVLMYEAHTMSLVSGESFAKTSSTTATFGNYLQIKGAVTASKTVSLPASADSITIRARADLCEGAPILRLTVNGTVVNSYTVPSPSWEQFTFPVSVPAGSNTVAVKFMNDKYMKGVCDRNLEVDWLSFTSGPVARSGVSELPDWPRSTMSTNVALSIRDRDASGGRALGLWSQYVTLRSHYKAPAGRLVVRARGEMCEGAPKLQAKVNGTLLSAVTVSSSAYADYDLGAWPGGTYPVELRFTNDHLVSGSCDRNAIVDTIRVGADGKDMDAPDGFQLSDADEAIMAAQKILVPYAAKITGGKEEKDRHTISGYSGLEIDAKTKTITLHWKGTLPSATQSIVDNPPTGVTVVVKQATFTRGELMAARAKLVDPVTGQTTSAIASQGGKINKIGSLPSGRGLQVSYTSATVTSSGETLTTDGTTTPEGSPTVTDAELESIAGVPVSSIFEATAKTTAARQNDNSSWYGGAALISPTGKYCTAGFGAKRRSDGRHVVLTADHCAGYGTGTYRDPAGETVGAVLARNAERDVAVIAMPTGKSAGNRVWWGGPLEDDWSRGVRGGLPDADGASGSDYNFTGQHVCTSGASTGVRCGIVITCDDCSNITSDGVFHSPVITGTRLDNSTAVGTGDSGGPVVSVDGYSVTARGIISSGNNVTTCPSVTAVEATCFSTVNYIAIRAIMRDFGLDMMVAP